MVRHRQPKKNKKMSEQFLRNLRIVGWVVLVLVVVGGISLWFAFHDTTSTNKTVSRANPVSIVPNDQLPIMFPPDIPIEAGAAVKSNFNAAGGNGQFQATRSFVSAKSVAINFSLYQQFLANNAKTWTIISTVDNASDQNNESLFAKSNAGLLTIAITALPPQPFPASLVTITYITNPTATAQVITASTSPASSTVNK